MSALSASSQAIPAEDPRECRPDLSRHGFLQEMLFPQGTTRTPHFDDYTEGSYHVDKLDLLDGVRELAAGEESIVGFHVFGPYGPLWAYHVVLVLKTEDGLRVNWLNFPHARITSKGTWSLSWDQYREYLVAMEAETVIAAGLPSFESICGERNPDLPIDWHYSLLTADWSGESERVWHAVGDDQSLAREDMDRIVRIRNLLAGDQVTTYTTYLPDGYDAYICPDEP